MPNTSLVQDSKAFVLSWLRQLELRSAGGDEDMRAEIVQTSDEDLLKKWLWRGVIYVGMPVFIGLPLVLSILGFVFTPFIMEIFWFFTKLAMVAVFAVFGCAIYLTVIKK